MDERFEIADLFGFQKMIAPRVLKIIYWLGLIGIAIMALISFVGALAMLEYSVSTALGTMLMAVIGLAFGTLLWRVLIEVYTVFFNIHDRVTEIRNLMRDRNSGS